MPDVPPRGRSPPLPGAEGSGVSAALLTESQWAQRLREERAVRSKAYQLHPLGMEVARFLRAKRLERCSPNTLLSYETTLCRFVLDHRDIDQLEHFAGGQGSDLVNEFLEHHWGEASEATIDNRVGAMRSFFAWAEETDRISRLPRVKRRRVTQGKVREAHSLEAIRLIVAAQDDIADEVGLLLMGRLGFRKDDVRRFQVRDVDIAHDRVFVRQGKGGKPAELPIVFDELREALVLWLAQAGGPEVYLWHPQGRPLVAPDPATVHRRFKRCLERAGVDDFPMHELRHSAGDRLWRETGDVVAASQLLRHSRLDTTQRYLHPTPEDLRARMRASESTASQSEGV